MPEQQNQPPKQQNYVVKTDFTDDKGRKWTVGSAFTGDGEAVKKALAAGRIAARPPEPEPKADA
jgi:transcriptional regulator CtsR